MYVRVVGACAISAITFGERTDTIALMVLFILSTFNRWLSRCVGIYGLCEESGRGAIMVVWNFSFYAGSVCSQYREAF